MRKILCVAAVLCMATYFSLLAGPVIQSPVGGFMALERSYSNEIQSSEQNIPTVEDPIITRLKTLRSADKLEVIDMRIVAGILQVNLGKTETLPVITSYGPAPHWLENTSKELAAKTRDFLKMKGLDRVRVNNRTLALVDQESFEIVAWKIEALAGSLPDHIEPLRPQIDYQGIYKPSGQLVLVDPQLLSSIFYERSRCHYFMAEKWIK